MIGDRNGDGNGNRDGTENGDGNGTERGDENGGGTYTLVVDVAEPATIEVGALGEHTLDAGTLAYTGSALGTGGFARVDRHRRTARGEHDVRHWHVDHLLGRPDVRIDRVVRSVGVDVECAVAEDLPAGPIDGFGASDCDCPSHLAAGGDLDEFAARIREVHEAATADIGGGRVDVVGGSDRSAASDARRPR